MLTLLLLSVITTVKPAPQLHEYVLVECPKDGTHVMVEGEGDLGRIKANMAAGCVAATIEEYVAYKASQFLNETDGDDIVQDADNLPLPKFKPTLPLPQPAAPEWTGAIVDWYYGYLIPPKGCGPDEQDEGLYVVFDSTENKVTNSIRCVPKFVVPAIKGKWTVCKADDPVVLGTSIHMSCRDEYSCADSARVLLNSQDGKGHYCVKF